MNLLPGAEYIALKKKKRSRKHMYKHKRNTYRHAQTPGLVMPKRKVFVGKFIALVNAGAASAIGIQEIATLDHEPLDLYEVNDKRTRGRLIAFSINWIHGNGRVETPKL